MVEIGRGYSRVYHLRTGRLRIPDSEDDSRQAAPQGEGTDVGTPEMARQVHPSRGPSDDAVLIAEANALGLVSDREAAENQVRIRLLSGRGTVYALVVRGHVIGYAKRPAPGLTGSRRLAHERVTMGQLSSLDLVPRPVPQPIQSVQRHPATLWMSALPGSRLDQQAGTMPYLADLAQAWGLALARLHTERAVRPRTAAPRPWVLRAEAPPTRPAVGSSSAAAVLRLMANDASLRRAAHQAADRWGDVGWIHGDLDVGHVIVATGPDVRVRFADVSTAGAGDPAWDVASALESLTWQAEVWRVSERVLNDYFLRGYRRGGGPGRVDPELRALRAVEVAWRIATAEDLSTPTVLGDPVARWLDRARAHAGRSGQLGWAA